MNQQALAFVDLETTGLSPTIDRITEIGVVTVDSNRVEEWTTLLNPGIRINEGSRWFKGGGESLLQGAPVFQDIATGLARRLSGRLFIAHNARFDYGFLKAEFERVGIEFSAAVLCSAMLSRKLYAHLPAHDLDALMASHNLDCGPRHRALPDLQLIWQLWQVFQRERPTRVIADTVEGLLAGPVLPGHLDSTLIDKLPDRPGIYSLHGERDETLHVGHASNIRLHLLNYFRIDRTSIKALELASRIQNITFRVTAGVLGARLQAAVTPKTLGSVREANIDQDYYSWRLIPGAYPSIELLPWSNGAHQPAGECFGRYP